ncbi:MAG: hypothetical protein IPJ65_22930 [Archangiaceae bacterium]|nr:hypothetical protein [Archangiaceae bacterium]
MKSIKWICLAGVLGVMSACGVGDANDSELATARELGDGTSEATQSLAPPGGGGCVGNQQLECIGIGTKARAQALCNAGCCSHRCHVVYSSGGSYPGWQGWCY